MIQHAGLIVDDEFQAILPPQTVEEHAELEQQVLREGCADAVVVWSGENIILDGHHRYALCKKHKLEYRVRRIDLPDRNAAIMWIIRNQFARRNLTPFQRAELALKLKPMVAKGPAERRAQCRRGVSGERTNKTLSKLAGVSDTNIMRANFINGHGDERIRSQLRRGEISIHRAYKSIRGGELESSDRQMVKRLQSALQEIRSYEAPIGQPLTKVIDHLQDIAARALSPVGERVTGTGE